MADTATSKAPGTNDMRLATQQNGADMATRQGITVGVSACSRGPRGPNDNSGLKYLVSKTTSCSLKRNKNEVKETEIVATWKGLNTRTNSTPTSRESLAHSQQPPGPAVTA